MDICAFTAATTTEPRAQWQIPGWTGSFADARAEDLLHQLHAGLAGCGLRPLASEAPTHMACLEAID